MTGIARTSRWHTLAATGVLCLTLASGCSSSSSAPAALPAGISGRTLVDAHWGGGGGDWAFFSVQVGIRFGPSLLADPAHHVLYVTDPAHQKLRAYDDRTGKVNESYEAPITGYSVEGATSPKSGAAYILDWTGDLQRIADGKSLGTTRISLPRGAGTWSVSGPLAVTSDETVWLRNFDGWKAVARGGVALDDSASGGTPPADEARLAGNSLVVGVGTAERTVILPASVLPPPTPSPLPDAVIVTWAGRSPDSGDVWAVINVRSHPAPHYTLVHVTAAGKVLTKELPPPPDDAPAPYALTSTGLAVLNGNDPQVILYSAG